MPNVVDLQRADDPRDAVHRAVQALAEGHLVCVPTETVYCIVTSALHASAMERFAGLDAGDLDPSVLAVKSSDEALDYLCEPSPLAIRLARHCWPGPVSLETACQHPDSALLRVPAVAKELLLAKDNFLGLRVVKHPVVTSLLQYWSGPLLLTGLTAEQNSPVTSGSAATALVGSRVSLLLDDGPTRYGGHDTVVRIEGNRFSIQRHGVVEADVIRQFAQPLILLVCTGNTCRSPMAEALLNHQLQQSDNGSQRLVPRVESAGLAAMEGEQASPQAVEVLRRRGVDLQGHTSRCVDEGLLLSADLILTMTQNHATAILKRFPQLADRVHTLRLDGGDVVDPIGGSVEVYESCAEQIDRELKQWMHRLGKEWLPMEESSDPQ